ncbi:hypothetical protein D9Q98_009302 [Chlorella vulgaris]|uniref:Uncharacterized protein n=1 Tax=Chlorella vulgaris TaxID=3077 RepID=A0A9D4TPG5_CHLVU|nr:hypothetical protein D9Q98_009302 [Chlorella vulgaris]
MAPAWIISSAASATGLARPRLDLNRRPGKPPLRTLRQPASTGGPAGRSELGVLTALASGALTAFNPAEDEASSDALSFSSESVPSSGSQSSRSARGLPAEALSSSSSARTESSDGSGGSDGLADLTGIWIKDAGASDSGSYSRACDLMQLNKLQKTTATQLIEGLELEQNGRRVAVRFLTVVPFFKVSEEYVLGSEVSQPRRDLRGGKQRAAATPSPNGGLEVQISWGAPNVGGVNEKYSLLDDRTLECLSTVDVRAGSVTTRTVYRKVDGGWRPRLKWNPLAMLRGR